MLSLVKGLEWKAVREALAENPRLIEFQDQRGRNWLHVCCGVNIKQRKLNAVDSIRTAGVLLDAGLSINKEAFQEENFKATPLWYAVGWGQNHKLAAYLLENGCDPNHSLFAAAFNNDVAMIRLLVKHGADLDPNVEDATPCLFAVQWSRFAAAEELLKLGADVNFQNSKGVSALHCMLKKGSDKKYIRMLIPYGARGDLKDAKGETAAAILMRKKDPELRKLAGELRC